MVSIAAVEQSEKYFQAKISVISPFRVQSSSSSPQLLGVIPELKNDACTI